MREIKFRGKRVDNGEFVFGNLFHEEPIKPNISFLNFFGDMNEPIGIGYEIVTHEVIPETIGQYTGFKDKYNKPLYEGDIVRDDENLCVVVFIEKWGMFSLILKEEYESYKLLGTESLDETMFFTFNITDRVFKLIGNIHDNEDWLQTIT